MIHSIIQKSQLEGVFRLDAEYYQPEYLELENKLLATRLYKLWKEIDGKFITGPFGSEFNVENYIDNGKYRYIRGKDVKDFFLQNDDNVYIPEKDFTRLKKYSLQEGDILVSVVGSPGCATIVDFSALPAIFSCKSTVFRTLAIDSYYFIAYLNSKYGQSFLQRSIRGALQTGLNIDDLRDLPIYLPPPDLQKGISEIVKKSKQEIENSRILYTQAENLLLEELGLKDFEEKAGLFSIVNFSDIEKSKRIDAEYFQSTFEKIRPKLKSHKTDKLGDLASLKKGFEPGSGVYQEEGKLFIRVSSLSKNGITDKDQKYLNDKLYNELKPDFQPKIGEILLTKDATPGIAYVLKEPIEGIISGGILRLKLNEDIEPEYLALVINSIVGQYQAERDAGGSIIAHWKSEQIKEMVIPILPRSTQEKISDLVKQSHETRKKAKQLLEEAKYRVEELIEKGKI